MVIPTSVDAPVVSSFASKINWTQVIGIASMIATVTTGGKLNLSPGEQASIVTAIGVVQGLATVIFRTWFTTSVLAPSLPPVTPPSVPPHLKP